MVTMTAMTDEVDVWFVIGVLLGFTLATYVLPGVKHKRFIAGASTAVTALVAVVLLARRAAI